MTEPDPLLEKNLEDLEEVLTYVRQHYESGSPATFDAFCYTAIKVATDFKGLVPAEVSAEDRARWLADEINEETTTRPSPLGMIPTSYPPASRRQGHQGNTEVALVIDEAGVPVRPLLRASCGVPGFDVEVMETSRFWSFTPATTEGQPVVGTYVLSARFHLGGG